MTKKERQMKRLILILFAMFIYGAHAADINEVCRRNSLVMVVLQKDVNGTNVTIDTDEQKWTVDFPYDLFAGAHTYDVRKIKGRTTCNEISVKSSADGKKSDDGAATSGDVNTYLKASPRDVGVNCWCKMDGPVTSWWTYMKQYDSRQSCADNCTTYCANGFKENTKFENSDKKIRDSLYYTIW